MNLKSVKDTHTYKKVNHKNCKELKSVCYIVD